jgi:hypothetical protein
MLEVIRFFLGELIVVHGVLTAMIWVSTPRADDSFRATNSWLLGEARSLAVILGILAAAGFVLAGLGIIVDQAWWAATGVAAGAVGLLLMVVFFSPWLLAGITISAALLCAGIQALPQV